MEFRKLKSNEIDVRVGSVIATEKFEGVSLMLYKDARCDMNILDETVGCMNWMREHSRENRNCRVGIWDNDKNQWIWKEDTGTESNTEAEKGLASDSFKRACVNWGIGRELYTTPNIIVPCELVEKNGKKQASPKISWYVKDIVYNDGSISRLKIIEKTKKSEVVVFDWADSSIVEV